MIKIHVGCGKRFFPGWLHVDGESLPHIIHNDVYLSKHEENSVDTIYSSHLLSYFDRFKANWVLIKWHQVLKVGGVLRLAVPDFEAMARLYVTDTDKYPLDCFLGPLYGKMQMNNQLIYHQTCYDFKSLSELLIQIGFKDVRRYDWRLTEHAHIDDQSQAYLPHMDKENGTLISLNVEATK